MVILHQYFPWKQRSEPQIAVTVESQHCCHHHLTGTCAQQGHQQKEYEQALGKMQDFFSSLKQTPFPAAGFVACFTFPAEHTPSADAA